jgi:hypothetical protein
MDWVLLCCAPFSGQVADADFLRKNDVEDYGLQDTGLRGSFLFLLAMHAGSASR